MPLKRHRQLVSVTWQWLSEGCSRRLPRKKKKSYFSWLYLFPSDKVWQTLVETLSLEEWSILQEKGEELPSLVDIFTEMWTARWVQLRKISHLLNLDWTTITKDYVKIIKAESNNWFISWLLSYQLLWEWGTWRTSKTCLCIVLPYEWLWDVSSECPFSHWNCCFFAQVGNESISVLFLLGNCPFAVFPELVSTSI